jgi:hypothetical protein
MNGDGPDSEVFQGEGELYRLKQSFANVEFRQGNIMAKMLTPVEGADAVFCETCLSI